MKSIIFLNILILILSQDNSYNKSNSQMIKNKNFSISFPIKGFSDSWTTSMNVTFKRDSIKFNNRYSKYGYIGYLKPILNDEEYEFDMKFTLAINDNNDEEEKNNKDTTNGFYIQISNNSIKNLDFSKGKIELEGMLIFFLFNNDKTIISHKYFHKKTIVDKTYIDYLISTEEKLKKNDCLVDKGSKVFLKLDLDFGKLNSLKVYLGNIKYGDDEQKDKTTIKNCYTINKINKYISKNSNYLQIINFSGDKLTSNMYIFSMDLYENKSKYRVDEENKVPNYLIREYIDHINNLGYTAANTVEDLNKEYELANDFNSKVIRLFKYSSEIHKGYKQIHEFIFHKLNKIKVSHIDDFPMLAKIEKVIKRLETKEAKRFEKFQKIKNSILNNNKIQKIKINLEKIEERLGSLSDILDSNKLTEYLDKSSKLVNIVSKINLKFIYYKAKRDIEYKTKSMKKSMIISYILFIVIFIIVLILSIKIIRKLRSMSGYKII